MANGRLASVKIMPGSAALVYSNTSGKEASINLSATALSTTTTSTLTLNIDQATVPLNMTTTEVATPSSSISAPVMYVDYTGANSHHRFTFDYGYNQQFTTWNGTSFAPYTTYPSVDQSYLKVDPYYISNPTAYGRTSPIYRCFDGSGTTSTVQVNLGTMTRAQFAQALNRTGVSGSGVVSNYNAYWAYGYEYDPYTNYSVGINGNYYMIAQDSAGTVATRSTDSVMYYYNNTYGWSYYSTSNLWYAPRVMSSNGLFIVQFSGYSTASLFQMLDATQNPGADSLIRSSGGGTWWGFVNPSSSGSTYGWNWIEYNPNNKRYYMKWNLTGAIYSFTRAEILSVNSQTSMGQSFFSSNNAKLEGTYMPYMTRPLRVGASVWQAIASDSTNGSSPRYVWSTDLVNWSNNTSAIYPTTAGYPANIEHLVTVNDEIYIYSQSATADIRKFNLNYASISDLGTIEYQTPLASYQRSGLLVSDGDKLYAKNTSSVPVVITVMGYEG